MTISVNPDKAARGSVLIANPQGDRGGLWLQSPLDQSPGHLREQPGGDRESLLSAASASCPSIGSQHVSLLPTDTSPEVPRHQAGQSQLAASRRANGPTAGPSALRCQLHACGRRAGSPSEGPRCQPLGTLGQLAGWQDWPAYPSARWRQMNVQGNCARGPQGASSPQVPCSSSPHPRECGGRGKTPRRALSRGTAARVVRNLEPREPGEGAAGSAVCLWLRLWAPGPMAQV